MKGNVTMINNPGKLDITDLQSKRVDLEEIQLFIDGQLPEISKKR